MATKKELEQERQLIELARKDPNAFGLLFDKYYQPILNYSIRRTGDVMLAQDITSTVFMKAYEKLWQFKWRGIPFVAWLYRIAGNEIKSYYRKGEHSQSSLEELREISGFEPSELKEVDEELIAAEEALERHQQFLEVQEEIAELDSKYQEVLHLRFFEKMKINEISLALGKKPGTIKSLVSRGLAKIRSKMKSRSEVQTEVEVQPKPSLVEPALNVALATVKSRKKAIL